jgi:hypothetical protein
MDYSTFHKMDTANIIYTVVVSLFTLSGHYVIGNKYKWAYLYNMMVVSPVWFIWMYITGNWGFVVLQVVLIGQFIAYDRQWRKSDN